ncbi:MULTISPECIES: beta-galactosidase [unclassified Lentimonas]|uniref:beta-galactosidase n=1 Tax=unclassified Lentimonas TaxID=2630993 RepID=UPI0013256220|nr:MULTISPECIES: beta-galactosidase [unclassified Lentimonas]CAA6692403.1 Unannotated [Lentimonas sp. CC19]CAA6693982.1 Unannotated [Lentimonas sp. CC10]CAA7072221.1 Unannotated [Lentimonas sp. CC11]
MLPHPKQILLTTLACAVSLYASADTNREVEWLRLNAAVDSSETELVALIEQAQAQGINTQYAAISAHTIATFQTAAAHDYANNEQVREIFSDFKRLKADRVGKEAKVLPFNELNACLDVAAHAIAQLEQQLGGLIRLSASPDLSKGQVELGNGYYQIDGRPFFPSSLVWLSTDEAYVESYGRIGQGANTLSRLKEDGTVGGYNFNRMVESASHSAEHNLAPYVFFNGHNAAGWMKQKHPEIEQGGRNFTQYDIDSPLIRKWFTQLAEASLPKWSGALPADYPRMHLLANEPHFATAKGGWRASNGLSDFTIEKYHAWLAQKYTTIDALNEIYGTACQSFDEVTFYDANNIRYADEPWRARQIDMKKTRGGPVWYDWCRFNQSRVNEWFTFLKEQVQANDGVGGAPVSIKMLGFTLSRNTRDGGMDLEYLTNLQEVMGADLRVVPQGAEVFGKHEEGMAPKTGWMNYFAYDWSEQSMFLDFSKSLCPDKPFYDSEWHGFSAVSWRHFNMSREYVRSALWMAFADGMSMIKPWVWGRDATTGALSPKADHIGELSTQPVAVDAFGRTMKELNAHAAWLAPGVEQERKVMLYYCEEAAIQDDEYTNGFKYAYEALKLLNMPVGFATPSTIRSLDSKSQMVLVTPTQFISESSLSALQAFQQSGGRVILVGESFQKNEQGFPRGGTVFTGASASLPEGYMMDYVQSFTKTLTPLLPSPLVDVRSADESGADAYGVMIKQIPHHTTGHTILILNNVSKDARSIELPTGQYADMITRQLAEGAFVMNPCDVRVLLKMD